MGLLVVKISKCQKILQNRHRDPTIRSVHIQMTVNSCNKINRFDQFRGMVTNRDLSVYIHKKSWIQVVIQNIFSRNAANRARINQPNGNDKICRIYDDEDIVIVKYLRWFARWIHYTQMILMCCLLKRYWLFKMLPGIPQVNMHKNCLNKTVASFVTSSWWEWLYMTWFAI